MYANEFFDQLIACVSVQVLCSGVQITVATNWIVCYNFEDIKYNEICKKELFMSNKVVAVVGMCGSGKSVLTEMFVNNGWNKVYFGGVTVTQLQKQGIPVNEANERQMRESLRKEYGQGAFAILLEQEIAQKMQQANTVLDGLYSWSEYKHLKQIYGDDLIVLAVVTNSGVRYERLSSRQVRPLTNEQACSRDFAEIENSEKGGPIAIADYYIDNNGSLQQLTEQFEQFMAWLNN